MMKKRTVRDISGYEEVQLESSNKRITLTVPDEG